MVIIVLLDGGGEACSDGDVRDFVFAVGAQLDFAALANLLDKAHSPCDGIGVGLQFIAVGEVFKFGIEAIQNTCGRNFDTYEERNIFSANS